MMYWKLFLRGGVLAVMAVGLQCSFQFPARAQAKRKIIIDQDCAGPGGTDMQAILALVNSPETEVLGITVLTGDAAHALPPNIGQGGGCAMMNGLSLAVFLDRFDDVPMALEAWEQNERPMTDHTQRMSYFLGLPTTWPPALRALFFKLAGRSKWMVRQRTLTARHRPTGTEKAS